MGRSKFASPEIVFRIRNGVNKTNIHPRRCKQIFCPKPAQM